MECHYLDENEFKITFYSFGYTSRLSDGKIDYVFESSQEEHFSLSRPGDIKFTF